MKIRNGFVSNSSSSSYIIDAKAYPNVFALALEMLKIRNDDDRQSEYKPSMVEINRIKKSKLDVNTPVAFSTCNYDTYIAKVAGFYLIQTCQNQSFNKLKGQVCYGTPIPKEVYIALGYDKCDILKIDDIREMLHGCLHDRFFFWWPRYNLKAKNAGNEKYCEKHYRIFDVLEDGTITCLDCYAEKTK